MPFELPFCGCFMIILWIVWIRLAMEWCATVGFTSSWAFSLLSLLGMLTYLRIWCVLAEIEQQCCSLTSFSCLKYWIQRLPNQDHCRPLCVQCVGFQIHCVNLKILNVLSRYVIAWRSYNSDHLAKKASAAGPRLWSARTGQPYEASESAVGVLLEAQ